MHQRKDISFHSNVIIKDLKEKNDFIKKSDQKNFMEECQNSRLKYWDRLKRQIDGADNMGDNFKFIKQSIPNSKWENDKEIANQANKHFSKSELILKEWFAFGSKFEGANISISQCNLAELFFGIFYHLYQIEWIDYKERYEIISLIIKDKEQLFS